MIFEKDGKTMTVKENCATSYLRHGWKKVHEGGLDQLDESTEENIITNEELNDDSLTKESINSLKLVELKIKAKELELETTAKSTADELKALIIEKLGL